MLLVLGLALHATGLLFDMMLEGRLPTTNVYSSIILAGWCVALVGGAAERARRNGVGLLIATLAGLSAVIGAHSLTAGGTLALSRAVLDLAFLAAVTAAALTVWFTGDDDGGRRDQRLIEKAAERMSQPLAQESV
jgi:ABC-type transport system involved in cytochrome c biogenesis permease subunit